MALNKAALVIALKAVFDSENTTQEAADGIADAIDIYVKTATVNIIQAGLTAGPLLDSTATPCTTVAPITGTLL